MSGAGPALPRSIVECLGMDSSRCGYCAKPNTSRTFGVWANRLSVADYQNLLDAGWRRSGSYLYRPDVATTCCPTFVVRLEASRFQPSSTHKRVLKRLRRASADAADTRGRPPSVTSCPSLPTASSSSSSASSSSASLSCPPAAAPAAPSDAAPGAAVTCRTSRPSASCPGPPSEGGDAPGRQAALHAVREAAAACVFAGVVASSVGQPKLHEWLNRIKVFPPKSKRAKTASLPVLWSSNAAMVMAALERACVAPWPSAMVAAPRQLAIAHALQAEIQKRFSAVHHVSVTAPGFVNFLRLDHHAFHKHPYTADDRQVHAKRVKAQHGIKVVSKRFEMHLVDQRKSQQPSAIIHEEQKQTPVDSPSQFRNMNDITKDGGFTMEMVPAQFRADAYEIFRKYQMTVHKDTPLQCGRDAYSRFLVDSPLIREQVSPALDVWYGSFHILYKLGGRLFAVGVVDLLPRCLSSVYLFYDPEYAKLSPGTLSALKEIEWVQRGEASYPSMKFYYMGFYIHSCPKMRYKASFTPSELLCDVTKNWILTGAAQRALDRHEDGRSDGNAGDVGGPQVANGRRRVARLAPDDMEDAPEAANFDLSDSELDVLTDDCKFQLLGWDFSDEDNSDEEGHGLVSMRSLDRMLNGECSGHMQMVRLRLRAFIQLVGRTSAKFFMHML